MRQVEVRMAAAGLADVVARNEDRGVIFLPEAKGLRAGERVLVALGFDEHPNVYTFQGHVLSVRARGRGDLLQPGVELKVDARHLTHLDKALAFARGERVAWAPRIHSRVAADLPVSVRTEDGGRLEASLRDLSRGGAGFSASGPLPGMGERLQLVFESAGGFLPLKLVGEVRWLSFFSDARGFGVRFVDGSLAWRRRLERLLQRQVSGTQTATSHSR